MPSRIDRRASRNQAVRAAILQEAASIAARVSLFGPGGIGRLTPEQVQQQIVQALLEESKKEKRNANA
ncbi:hypothetical protein [Thiobacter aerophilum]|uniref:Uncharacterized protein n=1 Tax=Thiobacter aerophilum TaxID=3121275 RepID=A0ABV0EGB2_9BURK